MFGRNVHGDAIAVAGAGANGALVHAVLAHDLRAADAVLLGIALIVQIVQNAHDFPEFLFIAIAQLAREIAHHIAHDARVFAVKFPFVVLREQRPRLFPVHRFTLLLLP